jgi:hypothetical protein
LQQLLLLLLHRHELWRGWCRAAGAEARARHDNQLVKTWRRAARVPWLLHRVRRGVPADDAQPPLLLQFRSRCRCCWRQLQPVDASASSFGVCEWRGCGADRSGWAAWCAGGVQA